MNITAVSGVAAAFEGARTAGVQQANASANANAVQKQNTREADELELKKTEIVEESDAKSAPSASGEKRVDIRV
jgi:hypothetical protein